MKYLILILSLVLSFGASAQVVPGQPLQTGIWTEQPLPIDTAKVSVTASRPVKTLKNPPAVGMMLVSGSQYKFGKPSSFWAFPEDFLNLSGGGTGGGITLEQLADTAAANRLFFENYEFESQLLFVDGDGDAAYTPQAIRVEGGVFEDAGDGNYFLEFPNNATDSELASNSSADQGYADFKANQAENNAISALVDTAAQIRADFPTGGGQVYTPGTGIQFNGNQINAEVTAQQLIDSASQIRADFPVVKEDEYTTLFSNLSLNGGGLITWTGSRLKWSERVLPIPVDRTVAPDGFFQMRTPLSGTVSYTNDGTFTAVTCDSDGIPLGPWDALYYRFAEGSGQLSIQSNYLVVDHFSTAWRPGKNWILLAVVNAEVPTTQLKWLPGNITFPRGGPYTYNTNTRVASWDQNAAYTAGDGIAINGNEIVADVTSQDLTDSLIFARQFATSEAQEAENDAFNRSVSYDVPQGFNAPNINLEAARQQISVNAPWNIYLIGDSRFNQGNTPTSLANEISSRYGVYGYAFPLGAGIPTNPFRFSTAANNGTTVEDVTGRALQSQSGFARIFNAGQSYTITGSLTDTLSYFEKLEIFYVSPPAAASIRISIDGNDTDISLTTGTGNVEKLTVTGLAENRHTTVISHLSGGEFALLEAIFTRENLTDGALIFNLGNSGISANGYETLSANDYLFNLYTPQLSLIRLGANDLTGSVAQFATKISAIATDIKSENGGVFLIAETDNTSTSPGDPVAFNAEIKKVSVAEKIGYIDLYSYVPSWTYFRDVLNLSSGSDPVHENSNGGDYIAKAILHSMFEQDKFTSESINPGSNNQLAKYGPTGGIEASPIIVNDGFITVPENVDGYGFVAPGSQVSSPVRWGNILGSSVGALTSRFGYPGILFSGFLKSDGNLRAPFATTQPFFLGRFNAGGLAFRTLLNPTTVNGQEVPFADLVTRFQINMNGTLTSPIYGATNGVPLQSPRVFRNILGTDNAGNVYTVLPEDIRIFAGINYDLFTSGAGAGGNNAANYGLRLRAGNNGNQPLSNSSDAIRFGYNGQTSFTHRILTRHTSASNGWYLYLHDLAVNTAGELGTMPGISAESTNGNVTVGVGVEFPNLERGLQVNGQGTFTENVTTVSATQDFHATTLLQVKDSLESEFSRHTGWAQYNDDFYTAANPLVVPVNRLDTFKINGATTIKSQLPDGVADFYDVATSKIIPDGIGDGYSFSIGFKGISSSNNGGATIGIDIGGTFGEIFRKNFRFPRAAGTPNDFYITIQGYSLNTFVANGGVIVIESDVGTSQFYDITLQVHRTHKAR